MVKAIKTPAQLLMMVSLRALLAACTAVFTGGSLRWASLSRRLLYSDTLIEIMLGMTPDNDSANATLNAARTVGVKSRMDILVTAIDPMTVSALLLDVGFAVGK